MGNKGNNRHIKRIASDNYVHVERKVKKYVVKPDAGRHTGNSSIALITVLKEKLFLAKNSFEARRAIKSGEIQVNGKVVKQERYPLGFGDIIHVVPAKSEYIVTVAKYGHVDVKKMEHKTDAMPLKVIGKYIASGKKIMIRLHDGTTVPGSNDLKVNDSVTLENGKVSKHMKLEKGAKCLVVKGLHASESGTIKEIKPGTATRPATVEIEAGKGMTETLLENILVTGGK